MFSGTGVAHRKAAHRLFVCLVIASLGGTLAGCVETMTEVDARATAPGRLAARPGVSPRAATVAFASVEGAPASVIPNFTRLLAGEARTRDITIADTITAKYLVRGYLSAYSFEGSVVIGYVWDVFDSRKARVQRLEDQLAIKGSTADPWSLADDKVLGSLAAKSADDLAALLTNMPEAAPPGEMPATVASVSDASATAGPGASTFR